MSISVTSPMSDEEQKLLDYRNATNFRSVKRADPSVAQILDTSVYSVIYNYDEGSGKWEKQKQEGPLFVVNRDKSPEWSLYMLNRQGLKNPAIPLIPGEMKLTIVDRAMLQVARRGDKQRIGIWFSEGPEAVDRFRTTVLGICGEPSKRPDLPNVLSSPDNSAALPTPVNEDGLSRLFAGLIKSPPIQSPPVRQAVPTPPTNTTTITTATTSATSNEPILSANVAPQLPAAVSIPTQVNSHTQAQLPISPPPPPPMHSPPGQTADDLLMSILGFAPPPTPPQHPQEHQQLPQQQQQIHQHQVSPAVPVQSPHPMQNIPPAPYPPAPEIHQFPVHQFPPQFQQQQYPPQIHHRPTPPPTQQFSPSVQAQQPRYHRIGDASFAQTVALPSPHQSSVIPSPAISSITPGTRTPNGYKINIESRNIMSEAVVDGVENRERDEGLTIAGIGLGKENRKMEFRRRLTDLILTDERFVDELWEAYLNRMSRVAQGGG
ncbi:uncharacterized protein IL334_001647 [Kwoniella shivajii]|uniref:Uncharacterized protein n=1 Tax=Kwoniella shivajii TaxID=564305 RepID=A0ABZ1CSQ9_9TREE|nr:hypothetical protein IL334_001647 [Kwoniella shivajii]